MEPKDIIKHKATNQIGFITEKRPELKGNRVDVQFVYDFTDITELEERKETIIVNGGCFDVNELELLIKNS